MNFGQNLYQWFLSNAQSLVLMAIVVIGIYLSLAKYRLTNARKQLEIFGREEDIHEKEL